MSHWMQLCLVESVSRTDKRPLQAAATSISAAHPDKQHIWWQCHKKQMDNIR